MRVLGTTMTAAAIALIASSTVSAATVSPSTSTVSPWAILTATSGGAPAAALCGAAVVTAAQPSAGCVLPQVDTAPPPPALGPGPLPAAYTGIGTPPLPVLAILLAVLGTDLYILLRHEHHHLPNSPA